MGIDAPDVMNKLGFAPAFVVPTAKVLVTDIIAEKPPAPVHDNPVKLAIANTVVPAVVDAK